MRGGLIAGGLMLLAVLCACGRETSDAYVLEIGPSADFTPADTAELLREVDEALPPARIERLIVLRPNIRLVWVVAQDDSARDRIRKALEEAPALSVRQCEKVPESQVNTYIGSRSQP